MCHAITVGNLELVHTLYNKDQPLYRVGLAKKLWLGFYLALNKLAIEYNY